jgi:NAD(P)-dependent dehydrogenase (short-subunit alcohol dehydrogenase family)
MTAHGIVAALGRRRRRLRWHFTPGGRLAWLNPRRRTMATILITGANRGIGLELARHYAADGHRVIRAMRGADKAQAPVGETLPLDVASDGSVAALADALAGVPIDLLVNNAGVIGPDMAHQTSLAMDFPGFAATLDVNVLGPLRVTQALLPNLRAAHCAKVAVVSSNMGRLSLADASGMVAYRASKAAVNKVFQCLAVDLRGEGIAVAMLHPGWVKTDMGGPGADIDVTDSAAGLRKVLDGLRLATTGRFLAYDGKELPW